MIHRKQTKNNPESLTWLKRVWFNKTTRVKGWVPAITALFQHHYTITINITHQSNHLIHFSLHCILLLNIRQAGSWSLTTFCWFTCVLQPSGVLGQCHGTTLPKEQKSSPLHSSSFPEQMSEQSGKTQPGTRGSPDLSFKVMTSSFFKQNNVFNYWF